MNKINLLISQANEFASAARGKVGVGEYSLGLNLYKSAVKCLLNAVTATDNESIKALLREKIDLYLGKAEECKRNRDENRSGYVRQGQTQIPAPQQMGSNMTPISPSPQNNGSYVPNNSYVYNAQNLPCVPNEDRTTSTVQVIPTIPFQPMPDNLTNIYPEIPTNYNPNEVNEPEIHKQIEPCKNEGNGQNPNPSQQQDCNADDVTPIAKPQNNPKLPENPVGPIPQNPRDPKKFQFQEFKSTVRIPNPKGHIRTEGLDVSSSLISKGTEGSVFRGTYYNAKCAVKVYFAKSCPISREDAINNIILTMEFGHPNIIQYYGYCDVLVPGETEPSLSLIMELCDGDMENYILKQTKAFDKSVLPSFLELSKGVASALSFLHSKGYVHSDVKPQNVLYTRRGDNMMAKLCDFGMTARLSVHDDSEELMATLVGLTANYSTPEIAKQLTYSNSKIMTTPAADVFAFGLILYFMLAKEHPYLATSKKSNMGIMQLLSSDQIPEVDPVISKWGKHPIVDTFADIIHKCLELDPSKRPTMKEICAELNSVTPK